MKFVDAKCPNCGAVLKVDDSKEAAICEHCGSAFIVEKAIQQFNITNVTNNNINAQTVNIIAKEKDFVIEAGVLVKYKGESPIVHVPDNVTRIAAKALPAAITELYLPDSVKVIDENAFVRRSATSDEEDLINWVSDIENGVLDLKKLRLSSNLERVDGFELAIYLESVIIPTGIKQIGNCCFADCINLKNVSLPEGLLEIGASAFSGCRSLKELKIPSTVNYIGSFAFQRTSITKLEIPKGIKSLDDIFYGANNLVEVILPDGIEELTDTFKNFTSLQTVRLPNTLKKLVGTFQGCTSLKTIHLPNNLEELVGTFKGCSSLINVNIPYMVFTIDNAFCDCVSLKELYISGIVITMCNKPFENCQNLTLYCERKKPLFGTVPKNVYWDKDWATGCKKIVWGPNDTFEKIKDDYYDSSPNNN